MGTHIIWALGTHMLWGLGTHILRVLGTHMLLGSGNSFSLWGLGRSPGGPWGPKGTFNTLRLVGRKLLSNIIAAVVAFLAAVIGFSAAVIVFFLAFIMGLIQGSVRGLLKVYGGLIKG